MPAVHDYRCDKCGKLHENCINDFDDFPCQENDGQCGGRLRKFYGNWATVGLSGPEFTPIRLADGREFTSKADWNRAKAEISANHMGADVEVVVSDKATKKRRHEERKHKTVVNRRRYGYCEKDTSERRAEIKAKKQEQANA